MSYDISMFWPWLLAALIMGAIVGWLSDRWRSGEPMFHGWRKWALVAWVVGLILGMLHWLPGRAGLWLETALLFSFCYAIACLIGGWLRAIVEGDKSMVSTNAMTGAPGASAAQPKAAPSAPASLATAAGAAPLASASTPAASAPAAAAVAPAAIAAAFASSARGSPAVVPDAETPLLLAAARSDKGDDLTRIKHIDGWTQGRLKALGVWHYGQIADWSLANAAWVEGHLQLNGNVGLEKWVDQATGLRDAPAPVAVSAPVDKPAEPIAAPKPLPAPTQNYAASAIAGVDGKPLTLTGAIGGQGDDLTRIKAIDARDAGNLNALGIWHYAQIAQWSQVNLTWVEGHFAAPGRVEGEQWTPQAARLVESGATKVTSLPMPAPAHSKPMPEPALTGKVEGEDRHKGARPVGYVSPRGGQADDLKRIRGIGPQNEGRLHALGIWHFAQIAAWSQDNVSWVGSYLAFPGRIDREEWIAQATTLADGRETEFSRRVEHGEVATSKGAIADGERNFADLSKIKGHD